MFDRELGEEWMYPESIAREDALIRILAAVNRPPSVRVSVSGWTAKVGLRKPKPRRRLLCGDGFVGFDRGPWIEIVTSSADASPLTQSFIYHRPL